MVAFLGPLIGAGASIAGGLIGANASSEAANMNWQINMLNYYQREKERREAKRLTDELRSEQKKGGTDAAGNRTYFDPVRGWVTELSDDQQELFDLQQMEQQNVLEQDLPLKRAQLQRQADRQVQEDSLADGAMLRFLNQRHVLEDDVTGALENAAARGNSRIYDEIARQTSTAGLNRGTPYLSDVMDNVGQSAADSLASTMAQAKLQGMGTAQAKNDSARSNNLNIYNLLASRASAPLNTPYQPQNITGAAQSAGGQYPGLAQSGNSAAVQAAMKQGGTLDYVQPDMGLANAISSGGAALGSAFGAMGESQNRNANNQMLMDYLMANSGGMNMNQGGIYAAMAARMRPGGGF